MQKLRVVLLFASVGFGHKRAAQAMGEAFEALPDVACSLQFVDIMEFLPRRLARLFLAVYFFSLRHCPGVYEQIYRWGNRENGASLARALMRRYLAYKLKRLFREQPPEVIISTHAAAAAAADYWLLQARVATRHVGIVTDFTVHRFWLNKTIDRYFVYDNAILSSEIRSLIAEDKVCPLGIPLVREFEQDFRSAKSGARKTILLMGGGDGLMPMLSVVEKLDCVGVPLCISVVTGHNKMLQKQLLARKHMFRQQLCVMGFVGEIADLMASADLLITKAGGVSVSEALRVGVPLFLYRPLPGQERINADFLLRHGVAVEIKDLTSITAEVDKIFGTENGLLQELQMNIKCLAKVRAAENIVHNITNKLYNQVT